MKNVTAELAMMEVQLGMETMSQKIRIWLFRLLDTEYLILNLVRDVYNFFSEVYHKKAFFILFLKKVNTLACKVAYLVSHFFARVFKSTFLYRGTYTL